VGCVMCRDKSSAGQRRWVCRTKSSTFHEPDHLKITNSWSQQRTCLYTSHLYPHTEELRISRIATAWISDIIVVPVINAESGGFVIGTTKSRQSTNCYVCGVRYVLLCMWCYVCVVMYVVLI